jgi:hypothetical protein
MSDRFSRPALMGDPAVDITDFYAFPGSERPENLVLVRKKQMQRSAGIKHVIVFSWVALFVCRIPSAIAQAQSVPVDNVAAENLPNDANSLTEINKELSNPVSTIWSIELQQNMYWLNSPERNNVNLQFQPILPVSLTPNWNLITRPVLQLLNSTPYVNESRNLHRVTGFGDTILALGLSPTDRLVGNWLIAVGPTVIFPTASNSRLGQNKWQLGPLGAFGSLGQKFLLVVFTQQWWSMGGPGSNTISQMNLQYFASYFFSDGWSVGTSPNLLVNWYANRTWSPFQLV